MKPTPAAVAFSASKGTLSLKADQGSVRVHFPPHVLPGIKQGDTLTVYAAYTKAPPPAAPLSTPPGVQPQGQHAMTGTATDVNGSTGKLILSTPEDNVDALLNPEAVPYINRGDTMTLYLGFSSRRGTDRDGRDAAAWAGR